MDNHRKCQLGDYSEETGQWLWFAKTHFIPNYKLTIQCRRLQGLLTHFVYICLYCPVVCWLCTWLLSRLLCTSWDISQPAGSWWAERETEGRLLHTAGATQGSIGPREDGLAERTLGAADDSATAAARARWPCHIWDENQIEIFLPYMDMAEK